MLIRDFIEKANSMFPDKEAVVSGEKRFTYRELYLRSRKLSRFMISKGLVKGDVISILHCNSHYFLETYFACSMNGIILNSINFRLSPGEISRILEHSGSKLLVCQSKFSPNVTDLDYIVNDIIWTEGVPYELGGISYEGIILGTDSDVDIDDIILHSDDPAHLYYTSGTTGIPKGVVLSNRNVTSHSMCAIAEFHLNDSDTWLHAAPLFHLADAWATFAFTAIGGRHVIMDDFTSEKVFRLIQDEGVTITNMIPTMLNIIVNSDSISLFDLSSLRVVLSGGAPIAPELVKKIINKFQCDYIQTYGMTETSPYLTVSILKEHLKKLDFDEQLYYKSKTGREFLGVSIRVVRNDGSDVFNNSEEVGEIIAKGDIVTKGYWNNPEATEAAFKNGWLYTGDLATIDKEGYVNIVDRKKDMIITGGENVYSIEVENILYEHHSVLEAAVIGIPDDVWGEKIKAFVALKDGRSTAENELIEFVKNRLAHYKAPSSIEFLQSLPKTGSGKITKTALR